MISYEVKSLAYGVAINIPSRYLHWHRNPKSAVNIPPFETISRVKPYEA